MYLIDRIKRQKGHYDASTKAGNKKKAAMIMDIPDLKGCEKETLFVIGNGFDLAHKLKTTYSDFRRWLMRDHQDFVEMMEAICQDRDCEPLSNGAVLWMDFEEALGRINADTAREYLTNKYGDMTVSVSSRKQALAKIQSAIDDISNLMSEWAKSIALNSATRRFNMPVDSRYFTFNYTLTLEKRYNISPDNILHIHGKVGDDKLIVGCERDIIRRQESDEQDLRRYSKLINDEMSRLNKPVDEMIEKYSDFFKSLESIKRVVVLGHSLSEIDLPYIKLIKKHIDKDAHWHFFTHHRQDHNRVTEFIDLNFDGLNSLRRGYHYISNVQALDESNLNARGSAKRASSKSKLKKPAPKQAHPYRVVVTKQY